VEPLEVLQQVAREVSQCTLCGLHHSRKRAVPGEGPADARIMLIGEGPGFNENEQGRPFVGQAGKLLEDLLGRIGMRREEVFITNVVKCRPPQNRDPLPEELQPCTRTYLARQIIAINPKVIVTLGRFSMNLFMPGAKISAVHGQPTWVKGRMVVPMFHPAAALHNQSIRPELEKDFAKLPEWIQQATTAAAPAPEGPAADESTVEEEKPKPKQLKLF
jgi:uracil-DNA glycosylase